MILAGDKLVIGVCINPWDRNIIYSGMLERIRLTTFSAQKFHPIGGCDTPISAGNQTDPNTGTIYFKHASHPNRLAP